MNFIITKLYNALRASHSDEAAQVLLDLLIAEEISAFAVDPHNDDHVIRLDASHWQSFGHERAEQIFRKGTVTAKDDFPYGEVAYRMHVLVPDWALDVLPPAESQTLKSPGSKRGAPPAMEWPVVWMGIIYIMSKPNRPRNQAELIDETLLWCQNNFNQEPPGVSTLKENLRGLFRILAEESPKVVFPNGSRPKRRPRKSAAIKGKIASR